ncbi:hypothetical protein Vretimale_17593 [Volvox reticuliferus]|uniref:Uncharacterized protein n=1 Tax=Volvox reticuliferus TaxID=1737510 RepID=A0A8J4GVM4_9CHLO|nr:hypothetical protein Vretifemale_3556 [Volvox reticuliferus]GIM14785.1 hypothetical protein Vretimale_17593 [Volvox reticuliferus]
MCALTTFTFAATVETYMDIQGQNDSGPNWQLYTQAIAWNQLYDFIICYPLQWLPYASFSLGYCPCASPPLPPSPPFPPSPPSPPPPPPLFCGPSLISFIRDDAYLPSIIGDVLFDETGSLMSYEYHLSEYKAIRSASRLTATPGTPDGQEASISMQVFLDLPAGTESTKAPRIPRIPRIPKPPHHPKRPAKPTRPARPLHHHRLARSSPPPS